MRRISKGATKRLAATVVKLTLEGEVAEAKKVADLLATFDNVQRLPGEDGQPGFGRGWGFGDPYNEYGYGQAPSTRKVPNTGDLPTTFDEEVAEGEDKTPAKKETKSKDKKEDKDTTKVDEDSHVEIPHSNTFDPDDFDIDVYAAMEDEDEDQEIIWDPDDAVFDPADFDMDVAFASAVEKVSSVLGKEEATQFAGLFSPEMRPSKVAEAEEEDGVDEVEVDTEEILEEEEVAEKKPRNRREVLQVWREDLIPDVTPIIRRVLKHVSVQYSLPFSTLTNALRGQESPVAGMLADALEGIEPRDEE